MADKERETEEVEALQGSAEALEKAKELMTAKFATDDEAKKSALAAWAAGKK
jgi:hypothetical protein